MKIINKTITATAIMSSLLSFAIQAALKPPTNLTGTEGNVTFKGEVVDVTCKLTVNGDDSGETLVVLPDIYKTHFAPFGSIAGRTAGKTEMVFTLSECSGSDAGSKKAQVFFDLTENVQPSTDASGLNRLYYKNLSSTGAAGDVGFVIIHDTVMFNPGEMPASAPELETTASGSSVTYEVAYYALSEAVTPGQVTSQATYTLQYN